MLTLVPTPIGNLEDITLRAIRCLKECDAILAEDTRQTSKLLQHLSISKPLVAFHAHNEHKALHRVTDRLAAGENLVLVSDAGTPGISDPGFLLVRACVEMDLEVETLPGPTAFVPALVNSGLPCDRFVFEGFLPQKKGRQKRMLSLQEETRTMVFYESPHRLVKALNQFIEIFGSERKVSVSREITKIHEETVRGTLQEVHDYYSEKTVKGEIVVVLAGVG
ncbi:16S rRNA (cytidine(1402)-2'-O)-methyltransferase [bacterium SCSIO 12741]|nr:16S rRNA (cytidine(1402)-2'-O)-methyltransferase [bacterium SCSIO 12741]